MAIGKIPRLNEEGKIPEEFLPEGSGGGENKEYIDSQDDETLAGAKAYADGKLDEVLMSDIFKFYVDSGDEQTLADAKSYADTVAGSGGEGSVPEATIDAKDAAILASSKEYTDEAIAPIMEEITRISELSDLSNVVTWIGTEAPSTDFVERANVLGKQVQWLDTSVSEELTQVIPVEPNVSLSEGTITIPEVEGIQYLWDTSPVSGTIQVADRPATIEIEATALTGYSIVEGVPKLWTYSFPVESTWTRYYHDTFEDGVARGRTTPGLNGAPNLVWLDDDRNFTSISDGYYKVSGSYGVNITPLFNDPLATPSHALEVTYHLAQTNNDKSIITLEVGVGNVGHALNITVDDTRQPVLTIGAWGDEAWAIERNIPATIPWEGRIRGEATPTTIRFYLDGQLIGSGPRSLTANPGHWGGIESAKYSRLGVHNNAWDGGKWTGIGEFIMEGR